MTIQKKNRYIVIFLLILCVFTAGFFSSFKTVSAEEFLEDIDLFNDDFTNLSDYICLGDDYYFVNSAVGSIVKTNSSVVNSYLEFGGDNGKLFNPEFISHISSVGFFVYDQLKRVQLFSNDFEYISVINLIDIDGEFSPLGDVTDMATDSFGKLYLLDKTNNAVLIKDSNYQFLTVINTDGLLMTEESKIAVSYNSSAIAVTNAGEDIVVMSGSNSAIIPYLNQISDIYFDCANSLFVFEKGLNQCKITKFSASDGYLTGEEEIFAIDYKSCFLEQETGNITFLSENGVKVITLENFTANALYFEPPIDFNLPVAFTEQIKIVETNKSTKLLQTPTSISAYAPLTAGTQILVLTEDIIGSEPFAYCYIESEENGYFGYVLKTDYEDVVLTPINSLYKTFYNNVKLYKYPTLSAPHILAIDSETELTVLNDCSDYKDAFGNGFYAVEYQEKIYYVNTAEIISTELFESIPIYQPNNDESFQLTAYLLILLCLFLTTVYVIIKISKANEK